MNIFAHQLGKRFNREWIFKNFSFEFLQGNTYVIVGPNGSGKSTLLQILWGQMVPSSGTLRFTKDGKDIAVVDVFSEVSIATPYMDLIEEFTLIEMVEFHFKHKKPIQALKPLELIERMELSHAKHKLVRDFSSGMKQRLKLGLAFFATSSALFLDEPSTNLDQAAFKWYWENLSQLPTSQLIFIASNQPEECPPEAKKVDILGYKKGYN